MKKVLLTGHKSGLGKFLKSKLKDYKILIYNDQIFKKNYFFDFIIHCAAKRPRYKKKISNIDYINSNIDLTRKLITLKFKKFIYISTIDVYPKNTKLKKENIIINLNKLETIYQLTKLSSEKILSYFYKDKSIILRLPSIIGKEMKKNIFYEIMYTKKKNIKTHFSKKSKFNIVTYDEILNFLNKIFNKNIFGVFNLANKKNVSIENLAKKYKKKVIYGKTNYNVGNISIKKIQKFL